MQSIARAAEILTCISDGVNSLSDIAEICHLGKSSAHRLLQALSERHLVTQDPLSRKYYLGYLITSLITKPEITQQYLTICADDELRQLADFSGETVSLGLMIALRYVNIRTYPSKYALQVIEIPRKMGSIYAGAAGRVLLSQLDDQELKRALASLRLEPITEYTTVDREKVLDAIKRARRQGYAISSNELTVGSACIAAPIKDYALPAVVYIVGPESRLKPRTSEFLEKLLYCAERISYNLAKTLEKK
jgi:IclR family KDG regulon transcriptional repressor